jgi:hypothetical protein
MKKYKHIYIIGRLPDEENSHYRYKNLTADEALNRFDHDLRAEDPEEYDYKFKQEDGCPVIYEAVLVSDSPIKSIQCIG